MAFAPLDDLGAQCAEVEELIRYGLDAIGVYLHESEYYWLVQYHCKFLTGRVARVF